MLKLIGKKIYTILTYQIFFLFSKPIMGFTLNLQAWVRLGLNDCLMESYLDAMTSDKKALE